MSNTGRDQILSHIPANIQEDINTLFKKVDMNKEFEYIFFTKGKERMNKEKYILLLKYIRTISKQKKLRVEGPHKTLDVNYSASPEHTYRITVDGENEINKIMNRLQNVQNKNYVHYKFLLHTIRKYKNNDKISFMLKTKSPGNTIDIDDLNMRIRLSSEDDMTDNARDKKYNNIDENLIKLINGENLDLNTRTDMMKKISFRLKERTSLFIEESKEHFIRVDLTDTKTINNINNIYNAVSNYELEIEYGAINKKEVKKEHLNTVYNTAETLLKIVQQSSFIVGNEQTAKVIQYYRDVLGITSDTTNLIARQTVSLEVQHATEILPNRYGVTDKADGDRYFMIIFNNTVYLISNNLNVKDTGIVLDKKQEKYNGSVLDGEYIYLPKHRRHLFMAFDCLKSGDADIGTTSSLETRLRYADKLIDECFIFNGQTGYKFKNIPEHKNGFDINLVRDFYGTELSKYYDVLNRDIQVVKQYPLIRRKFFMYVTGAKPWEIFDYSVEYWKRYSEDSNVKFPYLLDGLVYQPLEQNYVTNPNESKYQDYKWKPPYKNSIDFYIEFKRDTQTNKVLDVYDNSIEDNVRNKTYRICTLHCGNSFKGKEVPVPFLENYGIPDSYIYQQDGEIRDMSGDIISDKTVVEFYYLNDDAIIPQRRWVPIKTRYDKTEAVERYKRKYGNNINIAEKIWRSMINPVLMDDFIELAKGNNDKRSFYDIKIKKMNATISHKLIVSANKENKYYQKVSKIADIMRQWHGYIKSNLIYTYCNKMYHSNTQQSVLDIGHGRGGDIYKFYYTNVEYLIGIDIDAEGFKSPVDGAISRYNMFRKKKPNFPKMHFIQADAGALFNYDAQIKALSGMDDGNKKLLDKFFPTNGKLTLFDRISCQFSMHYYLKNETSWSNFKQNLKNHLRDGGYFFATTFDAQEIIKLIGSNESYIEYFDDKGIKNKFFEIIRRYGDIKENETIGVGNGIDLYASWMFNEGTYVMEYLVDYKFIVEEFKKDCDLELVDSDLFSNQYHIHSEFLNDARKYESTAETSNYLKTKAAKIYSDTDEFIKKCQTYSFLNRYYVFRKINKTDIEIDKKSKNGTDKKIQKGGANKPEPQLYEEKYNFSDVNQFNIPSMNNYDNEYSMVNSVHKILVSHGIFPKAVKVPEFLNDISVGIRNDDEVDNEYINDIGKNIVINHEITGDKKNNIKNIIDGLNIFIVERDCNNFYDIEYTQKANSKGSDKAIILMKEGGLYKPIMKKEGANIRGIFKMSDEIIEHLVDNGEKI